MNFAYRLLLLMAGAILVAIGFAFYLDPPHRMQPNQVNGIWWVISALISGGTLVPNFAIASFTEGWGVLAHLVVGGMVSVVTFGAVLVVWG